MNNPLITVYLVNHNYCHYVEQAVESVLGQTFKNFELIIIDDGSTDNSRSTLEKYLDHDDIAVIFQQNQGLTVTNNIALRAARGRYIMRLDADDYLDENALMVLSGILERNPDVGLVFPDYFEVSEDGTILEVVRRHNFDEVSLHDQPAHGACTMIRRNCLLEMGGYDTDFQCQDGYDLWVRFIENYKVQNVNLPLFFYRQHGNSLSSNEHRILSTRAQILEKQSLKKNCDLGKITCVIPVRGQSTDPHSIALKPLGGRPLIEWTIDAAMDSKRIDGIVVTTPDERILEHLEARYGKDIVPVHRDPKLALLNTYLKDTLIHALNEYDERHGRRDAAIMLLIESPFRSAKYIDKAVNVMEVFDTDTVIGVRPDNSTFYRHDGNGIEPLRKSSVLRLEKEELYREAGQISLVRRDFLDAEKSRRGGKVGHVVLDQHAAHAVVSEWAWAWAEFIAATENTPPAADMPTG